MKRIGRWIDFENDYKTLDPTFMESVWWVFKQLWDKGLVYRGFKVGLVEGLCKIALEFVVNIPLSGYELAIWCWTHREGSDFRSCHPPSANPHLPGNLSLSLSPFLSLSLTN